MFRSQTERRYKRRTAVLAPLATLWLAFGLCSGIILWVLAAVSLAEVSLDRTQPLALDWHQPAAEPEPLEFPAGIPFGTVLVREGEPVRAGQTLVALDVDALTARAEAVRRGILAARYERRCLIDDLADPIRLTELDREVDPETRAQLDAAALRCKAITDQTRNQIEPVAQAIASLQTRLEKLDRKLALTFRRTEELSPQDRASSALELTLDRNRTETLIALQTARMGELDAARVQARITRIDALTHSIEADRAALTQIEALRNKPRITAPRHGTITRVRAMPVNQISEAPIVFATVTQQGDTVPVLRAHMAAPAGAPRPGTPVELRVVDGPGQAERVVDAQVEEVRPVVAHVPASGVYVTIRSDDARDPARLDGGLPEIASARLARPALPLFNALWASIRDAVPNRGDTAPSQDDAEDVMTRGVAALY